MWAAGPSLESTRGCIQGTWQCHNKAEIFFDQILSFGWSIHARKTLVVLLPPDRLPCPCRELLRNVQSSLPLCAYNPSAALVRAQRRTRALGSSTACILTLHR